jgi:hypothetical protein
MSGMKKRAKLGGAYLILLELDGELFMIRRFGVVVKQQFLIPAHAVALSQLCKKIREKCDQQA